MMGSSLWVGVRDNARAVVGTRVIKILSWLSTKLYVRKARRRAITHYSTAAIQQQYWCLDGYERVSAFDE